MPGALLDAWNPKPVPASGSLRSSPTDWQLGKPTVGLGASDSDMWRGGKEGGQGRLLWILEGG